MSRQDFFIVIWDIFLEVLNMERYYEMEVAGLKRRLTMFPVGEDTMIAAFILFGDVELTVACAAELLKRAPEYDILLTAEAKSIPLIHEMARQSGQNTYVIARKAPKLYMEHVQQVSVKSITTAAEQRLCFGDVERELLKGKRVVIVDDVISTGESLNALEELVHTVGGTVVGKMAVLAEGDAIERKDITVLAPLPLFHADGTVK